MFFDIDTKQKFEAAQAEIEAAKKKDPKRFEELAQELKKAQDAKARPA